MALINGKNTSIHANSDAEDVKWFSLKAKVVQETQSILEEGFQLEKKVIVDLCFKEEKLSCELLITKKCEQGVISIERKLSNQTV